MYLRRLSIYIFYVYRSYTYIYIYICKKDRVLCRLTLHLKNNKSVTCQCMALFGESVMFKKLTKYKANDIFERGVWVGKHSWNDHRVVLTAAGAFEARTIRRLAAEDAFIASDLVIVKGLPWAYSPQGILIRGRQRRQQTQVMRRGRKQMRNQVM